MRKINLKAKNIATGGSAYNNGPSGKISVAVSIIILLLAGLLYGGATYLRNSQNKKIATTKTEIKNLKKSLDTNKDFKVLYDFQDRLIQLSGLENKKVKQINVLNQLAQSTLDVSVMKNLKVQVDNGLSAVNASLTVPDLMTVAKQINAYKEVSSQKQVFLGGSGVKEDKVEMSVKFTLPKTGPSQAE